MWLTYVDGAQSAGLRRLQDVQLDILDAFAQHCQRHDLEYFLVAGSALGAKRHEGMIPWDDDIDVAMLRPEYDRLLETLASQPLDGLFLQTYATDPNTLVYSAKVRKNGTVFHESMVEELEAHRGIFIDIFCYDRAFSSPLLRRLQRLCLSPLHILNSSATRNICAAAPNPIVRAVRYVAYYLRPVLPIRLVRWVQDRVIRAAGLPVGPGDLVGCFDIYGHLKYEKTLTHVSNLLPVQQAKFDHLTQPVPKELEAYLSQTFGDYMHYPSPENRTPAHAEAVQFAKEHGND